MRYNLGNNILAPQRIVSIVTLISSSMSAQEVRHLFIVTFGARTERRPSQPAVLSRAGHSPVRPVGSDNNHDKHYLI